MSFRHFVKEHLPVGCVKIILNSIFFLHVIQGNLLRQRQNSLKRTGPLRVLFIVNGPQTWNSFSTVYTEIKSRGMIPHIVVVPSKVSVTDFESNEKDILFYQKIEESAEFAFNQGKWVDLKVFKPDVIFRNTPYDEAYPKEYSMQNLAKIAYLCHVPYAYDWSVSVHYRLAYSDSFFLFISTVFSDSHGVDNFCRERLNSLKEIKHVDVVYSGFPRFELIDKKIKRKQEKAKCFLWIPRWSTDGVQNNATSFFRYKELLFAFFEKHKDLRLIIRPHQLMWSNFIQNKIMTQCEIDKLKTFVNSLPNISFDDNLDYNSTFKEGDVLIADFSSLIVEFFLSRKPIIYCGEKFEVADDVAFIIPLSYQGQNWKQLEAKISDLSAGLDPLLDRRNECIDEFWMSNATNASKVIVDAIERKCSSH